MAKTELTIVWPGLARIVGQQINAGSIPSVLAKIIKKAHFVADTTGSARLLFNHFSQTPLTDTDLPAASLINAEQKIIKADPCYLHPDRDRLLLFSDDLDITKEESIALIAEIQPLLEEFNGKLFSLESDSWLLTNQSGVKLNDKQDWSGSSFKTSNTGKHLWVVDELDLEADWQQQLQQFDDNSLQTLWQQLKNRKISKITLQIPDHGQYFLTPFDAWKFWK